MKRDGKPARPGAGQETPPHDRQRRAITVSGQFAVTDLRDKTLDGMIEGGQSSRNRFRVSSTAGRETIRAEESNKDDADCAD
jgi:hypothetical protein